MKGVFILQGDFSLRRSARGNRRARYTTRMVKKSCFVWFILLSLIVGCKGSQTNPAPLLSQTPLVEVVPTFKTPVISTPPSIVKNYILSEKEILSITDRWSFPGVDRTQDLIETYCGVDCIATEWPGVTDQNAKSLIISIIQHQDEEDAKNYVKVFEETMMDDGYAIVGPLNDVVVEDLKNAENMEFTEFYSLARNKNFTVQISMFLDYAPGTDTEKRGALVVAQIYALLQLDKLAKAGFFTEN